MGQIHIDTINNAHVDPLLRIISFKPNCMSSIAPNLNASQCGETICPWPHESCDPHQYQDSSRPALRLEQAAICWDRLCRFSWAWLIVFDLLVVAALSLLDWEGGHERQVLWKRLLLEPACRSML